MLEENLENETPTNDEGEEQQPEADNEQSDELDKAKEYGNNQKVRAEKAEAELKKLKAQAESNKPTETETPQKTEQSNEPDYAQLAYLEGKGLDHPDDQKIVQDEAKRLKLPLTDILAMEHIKAKLKDTKNQREAEDGMPDSSGKGGTGTRNSVDYWINKKNKDGSYAVPPDPKLHQEVINARIGKEKEGEMFDDIRV